MHPTAAPAAYSCVYKSDPSPNPRLRQGLKCRKAAKQAITTV